MVGISVNRELASERFEYGQHDIVVDIQMKYDEVWSHQNPLNYSVSIANSPESHYVRIVTVRAIKDGNVELSRTARVVLDEETEVRKLLGGTKVKNKVPSVRDHIEMAVRPIFERLDELYKYTTDGESIEIDVATHEVKAETSWVEVEDEVDRISAEIDALVEGSSA